MLKLSGLKVTVNSVITVEADVLSYLPPLFPFTVKIGLSGGQEIIETHLSKPPIKPEHLSASFTDYNDTFAWVEVTAVANMIRSRVDVDVTRAVINPQ